MTSWNETRSIFRSARGRLFRPRIEFRPALAHDLTVALVGVAAVEDPRPRRRRQIRQLLHLARNQRLVGDRRDRTEQLDQMRAAVDPAEALTHGLGPAGTDLETLQHLEIRRDI